MKKTLILLILIYSNISLAEIVFTVHQNPFQNTMKTESVENAVNAFASILSRECGIEFNYRVELGDEITSMPSEYKIEVLPKEKIINGEKNTYKFYQYELDQIVKNNNLRRRSNEVKILIVNDFDGYCGYAFPEIQFDYLENDQQNPLTNSLKNYILLHSNQRDCGGLNRLLSHELGHVFIQDNPAHMCTENGKEFNCKENNLMSVFRYSKPAPVFNPGGFGGGGMFDDPMRPRKLPSIGTGLLPDQCQAIRQTIEENSN